VQQIDLEDASVRRQYVRHIFPRDPKRVPMKMDVNGRKGRRVVCILYEDRLHYSVFDLDSNAVDEADEAELADGQTRSDDEIEMVDAD
jgi:anaphase-promoting complex subunit 4